MFTWSRIPIARAPLFLAIRNMRTRWVRSLLTMMGIVVGVAAMVSVSATNASTLNSINAFFDEASGQSDLLVEGTIVSEGFDESAIGIVNRFPEVVAAAPAGRGVTVLANEDWQIEFSAGGAPVPGSNFWLLGIDPETDPLVHEYTLVEGRLLEPNETAYNVVLVEDYAVEKELELGDDLEIALPPAGIGQLRIVGIIAKEGIGVTNEGAIGLTPLNVSQDLFNLAGQITQLEIVVQPEIAGNPDLLEDLRVRMEDQLGDKVDVKYPATRGQSVVATLRNYQLGLNFFSVVSLFVGSFLIYNAFAMTVVERLREIGMLRAVGSTRGQVMTMVLIEAVILGVIGSLMGVGLGLLLARGLIVFMGEFTGQRIDVVSATPESLIQAVVIGLVVTLVAALIPAGQAARISPLQALRVKGSVNEGRWFEIGLKFGPLTVLATVLILYRVPLKTEVAFAIGSNGIFFMLLGATLCIPIFTGVLETLTRPGILFIFGNEGRLGSSNINRARGRTTLTVAALMVGISMVIGINGLTSSFENDIQQWVDQAVGGDLYVRSPVDMRPDLESRLLALPEVTAVSKVHYVATRLVPEGFEDEFAVFTAIDPVTYLSVTGLRIEEGPGEVELMRQLAEGQALLISADIATRLNLGVDDWLVLETKRGQQSFRIAAVIIDFSGGDVPFVMGSWGDMRRYFGLNEVSRFTVVLSSPSLLEQVTYTIENELGRGQSLSVESREDFQTQIADLSGQAFALFDVLGLIGLVVAALGVINTMLMNVLERTREIGGLRSLGMTRAQVRRMILAEATAIGIIGAIFGVLFGAVLTDVFILGLRSIGGFVLVKQTPYGAMAVSAFVAVFVAIVASLYPAVRAGQVNIVGAIKNE